MRLPNDWPGAAGQLGIINTQSGYLLRRTISLAEGSDDRNQ